MKSSTNTAASAISAIVVAHIIIACFLYTAFTSETTKAQKDE